MSLTVRRAAIGGALAVLCVLALALGTGAAGGELDPNYPERRLSIMAPADPGGGWDTTARALQQTIREEGLGQGAEVYNVTGAGGTLGLSQLVSKNRRDPYQLMVMGLVMLGAVETNRSPVGLDAVTPITTLTTETEAIVVPTDSKYRTIGDLAAALKRDPGSVRWAGGSAGGTDQILVGELAKVLGADPAKTKYIAYSGGGEANTAILSGSVDAGVSGVSEFVDQVEAGKMRILAVSSPSRTRVGGRPLRTLEEQGIDLELTNWRGIVAPPDLAPGQRDGIVRFVRGALDTPTWREQVKQQDWTPLVRSGPDFDRYLDEEQARAKSTISELGLGGEG